LIQSFMALILNAMDAMDSRGTLTVRSRINPDRGDEILLEFIDTGTGIKREDLPKIFEPFFTTKPQGRGTGRGLSICYGIIAEHRGRVDVESQVGAGSDFRVYLPIGWRFSSSRTTRPSAKTPRAARPKPASPRTWWAPVPRGTASRR